MTQITFSELPETIQILINQINQTGNSLTIMQDGIPLAIISPLRKPKRAAFGVMKNKGKILGDIVEPTANLANWDVYLFP